MLRPGDRARPRDTHRSTSEPGDVGRVRGPRGTTQRRVGRLLVHVVPHLPRREGVLVRRQSSTQGATRPRGPSPRRAGLRRRRGRRVVPVRKPGRAEEHQAPQGVQAELDRLPDYRLTCFFVDKRYRRRGISALALQGALNLIAMTGGGVVEAYPQDTGGKKITASFLYSVTRSLFEQAGFSYVRPKGKNHTVMRTTIDPAR